MRHGVDGRKFGRNTSHRSAMLRNLANSVIQREQVVTTVAKAKEARRIVDRLVTLGKSGTPHARRLAFDRTRSKLVVGRLFSTLADRYKARNGGYTRVMKLSDRRWGDAAQMAVIEMVDHPPINRKRAVLTEEQQKKKEEAATAKLESADPLKKFRRKFAGSRRKARTAAAGSKAPKKAAASAGKKAEKKKPAAAKKAKKAPAKKKAD